tara:strand:+ start:229 stop:1101 length:873 start_codon:yes stop_codon:yes gene_type:complete
MAKPASRQQLIDYCKRQLGYPVLEINVADEQIEDLVDDTIQLFNERHFDGVEKVFLKYQLTKDDIDRGKARPPGSGSNQVGIASTSATTSIVGDTTTFTYYENSNYLQVPPDVIGVEKVFQFDNTIGGAGMFNVKYQFFLNDVFGLWGGVTAASGYDMLSYSMTMSYLETMNFLLNTHKHIRFNQRQDRLYLDIDYSTVSENEFLVIECYRAMSGTDYTRVWNDSFIKPYLTTLIKRQWGQNMMKFQGVKLPGGIELNGRQMYEDAERELEVIKEKMSSTYELPPLDMIG